MFFTKKNNHDRGFLFRSNDKLFLFFVKFTEWFAVFCINTSRAHYLIKQNWCFSMAYMKVRNLLHHRFIVIAVIRIFSHYFYGSLQIFFNTSNSWCFSPIHLLWINGSCSRVRFGIKFYLLLSGKTTIYLTR